MNKLDFAAINAALDPEREVPSWLPGGHKRGSEYVVANPVRGDRNPGSFSINLIEGNWKDFASGDGGSDLVSLYAYLFHDNDQGAAARELAENKGVKIGDPETRQRAAEQLVHRIDPPKPKLILPVPHDAKPPTFRHPRWGQPTTTYGYKDRSGDLLLYVCRFDPEGERKQVIPYSWCEHPEKDGQPAHERWTWRGITGDAPRPLYGLNRLEAMQGVDVIVCEGEKTADAGQRIFGKHAVCVAWLGGVETADRVDVKPLAGRRVFLWPDFDSLHYRDDHTKAGELMPFHEQPGIRAMMDIAGKLKGVVREQFLIGYTPEGNGGKYPHGWDLADADDWGVEDALAYMAMHSGDPWDIASGRKAGPQAEQPKAANDNDDVLHTPLNAQVNPYGWTDVSDKGQPLDTFDNLEWMLGEYGITVRYNEVRKNVEVKLPGRSYGLDNAANCSLAEINSIAARNRMPRGSLADYIKLISDMNRYNPAADWIRSKPWDGTSRLQALYDTVKVKGDNNLKERLMYRWLLSCVAALFKPHGFESHGALVFTGAQGLGKTTWFRRLVPHELGAVLMGAMVDPAQKDTVTNAISHWIVELGELDATFRKADIARLKSFITLPTDKLRRPYDRVESEYQRRTVFCASVNDDRYLIDSTGNRRWWTIPVYAIEFMHTVDMQQLWSELLNHYERGEQWWLTGEEEKMLSGLNAEHEAIDPVEELIAGAFDWEMLPGTMGWKEYTSTEVLSLIGFDKPNKAQATHASAVLKKMTGGDPRKTGSRRVFKMPPVAKGRERRTGYGDDSPI